jgi:uncharacterized membrane protein
MVSALSYGGSDYAGATAAKDTDAVAVAFAAQFVSLATLVAVLVVWPADEILAADLAWGALGGLGAAIALVTLYRALALGPMSTAASTTALVGVVVPVLAGLLLGDRPSAITMIGVALAIPAAVLVSLGGPPFRPHQIAVSPRDHAVGRGSVAETRALSVVAGLGFAVFFVALSRVSEDSGLFPLVGARGASILVLGVAVVARSSGFGLPRSSRLAVVLAGVLDCAANSFYLLALGEGSLVWVAAITSLYPVSTVLLARVLLDERMRGLQLAGVAGAAVALVLITVGASV